MSSTRGRSQGSASVGREPSAGKPRRSVRERCAHLKRTGAPCVLPAQTRLPAPNSARSEQTTAYGVNTHENPNHAAVLLGHRKLAAFRFWQRDRRQPFAHLAIRLRGQRRTNAPWVERVRPPSTSTAHLPWSWRWTTWTSPCFGIGAKGYEVEAVGDHHHLVFRISHRDVKAPCGVRAADDASRNTPRQPRADPSDPERASSGSLPIEVTLADPPDHGDAGPPPRDPADQVGVIEPRLDEVGRSLPQPSDEPR